MRKRPFVPQAHIFYATALKTLKRDFGNPVVVAHLKIKSLFDAQQIYANDQVGLRQFHQLLKCCITWFQSMGYSSAIESAENLTKAVMRLPNQLRTSFYKSTKNYNFLNGDVTLIEFEHWLENRVKEYFNPIANIIADNELRKREKPFKSTVNGTYSPFTNEHNDPCCWLCKQKHRLTVQNLSTRVQTKRNISQFKIDHAGIAYLKSQFVQSSK